LSARNIVDHDSRQPEACGTRHGDEGAEADPAAGFGADRLQTVGTGLPERLRAVDRGNAEERRAAVGRTCGEAVLLSKNGAQLPEKRITLDAREVRNLDARGIDARASAARASGYAASSAGSAAWRMRFLA